MPESYDAVIVGSGPNGLAAAIEIARHGHSVLMLEGAAKMGGGARTEELTLPGFKHDVCSATHPFGAGSPYLRTLPLAEHGLEWVQPPIHLAHPLDDGTAVRVYKPVEQTAADLGVDARAYNKLMGRLVRDADKITDSFLGPLLRVPSSPIVMARFGLMSLRSAEGFLRSRFKGERARAMLAGNAAHAMLPLDKPITAGLSVVYNIFAHTVGWPFARGGSQSIIDAMASYLTSMGGVIECNRPITRFEEIPAARTVVFDTSPRAMSQIAGDKLPARYRRRIDKFRYGQGVFKIDWALNEPIPWKAEGCAEAGTLHLGGTMEEMAASEKSLERGEHSTNPWVIVAQQSLFDDTRAPAGKHTAWAYCHVPSGSTVDMTDTIERQVERFAPGFRDVIAAKAVMSPAGLEAYNPNYIGGDIASGMADLRQMIARPTLSVTPYKTANPDLFICSSSTPPGPGVHGMCGYHAARAVLKRLR